MREDFEQRGIPISLSSMDLFEKSALKIVERVLNENPKKFQSFSLVFSLKAGGTGTQFKLWCRLQWFITDHVVEPSGLKNQGHPDRVQSYRTEKKIGLSSYKLNYIEYDWGKNRWNAAQEKKDS